MSEERFYNIEEVAERLQVSDQTVRRWIKSGSLPAYKPGLEWRIRPSDLEEFLSSRSSSPKAQAPSPRRYTSRVTGTWRRRSPGPEEGIRETIETLEEGIRETLETLPRACENIRSSLEHAQHDLEEALRNVGQRRPNLRDNDVAVES